jgi:hypothetical protein
MLKIWPQRMQECLCKARVFFGSLMTKLIFQMCATLTQSRMPVHGLLVCKQVSVGQLWLFSLLQ